MFVRVGVPPVRPIVHRQVLSRCCFLCFPLCVEGFAKRPSEFPLVVAAVDAVALRVAGVMFVPPAPLARAAVACPTGVEGNTAAPKRLVLVANWR